MPTVASGIRTTKNINQAQREFDVAKQIALLQPDRAPLTSLLRRLQSKVAINPIFNWFEDDLQGRWDAINAGAGYEDSATEVIVDTGTLFSAGDVVKIVRTGEIIRVTSVATNTLTIVRGYGTTAAAAIVNDDTLVILGNAIKEGGDPVTASGTVVGTVFNYTQIFKTSVQVTKTQEASTLVTGSDRAYQRRKKAIEHAVDQERAFWFGEKSEHVSGSDIIRTTGGVMSFLTAGASNVLDVSGASNVMSEDTFEQYLESLFRYGSASKLAFCSARFITLINSYGRDKVQLNQGAKKYGLNIYTYQSAHGELNMVKQQLFEGGYSKLAVILDMENLKYRPMNGRDTKMNADIQPKGADYFLDEYLTEAGLELQLPKTHGVILGASVKA